MQALRGGFKRFDDRKDEEKYYSRARHHTSTRVPRDPSSLPILNFEDSNGVSPANVAARWEQIQHDENRQPDGNKRMIHTSRVLRSVEHGYGDRQPRNRRQSKGRFGENESIGRPFDNIVRNKLQSQVTSVFDPFCVDDVDEIENNERTASGNSCLSPNSNWKVFSDEPGHTINRNQKFQQLHDPFQNAAAFSTNDFLELEETTAFPAFNEHLVSFGRKKKASRTQEYLKSLSRNRGVVSKVNDIVCNREIRKENPECNRARCREERNTMRHETVSDDEEVESSSSFPSRVKPIDFLKKTRNIEDQEAYSDDIFIKLDESSHLGSMPKQIPKSKSDDQKEAESKSESCTDVHPVQTETEIIPDSTGIEVVEVETVYSLENTEENEERSDETLEDYHQTTTELLSPIYTGIDYKTPREQLSPTRRFSIKTINNDAVKNSIPEMTRDSTFQGTPSLEDQKEAKDKVNAFQRFVEMAAPVISNGVISLPEDDPIRKAAEKLGIPITVSKNESSVTQEEEQVHVPQNVEVKCSRSQIVHTQELATSKHSIHVVTKKNGKGISSSNSLLDTASEVSDLNCLSHATSSSFNPKHHLQTIDLKSIHSGSVSALSLDGQLSHDSEDTSKESTVPSENRENNDTEKVKPNVRIPRVLVGRKEYDLSNSFEKPDPPRAAITKQKDPSGQTSRTPSGHNQKTISWHSRHLKTNGKPLGASLEEIEMINQFLALTGPGFDGSCLSIDEREQLHDKALKAGLTEDFINKILDQSAGILLWEQRSMSTAEHSEMSDQMIGQNRHPQLDTPGGVSTLTGRSFRTKDTGLITTDDHTKTTIASSYSEDFTYDEDGFTRKTPTEENKFNCFKNIFWMESSNIMGDDMTENILAVVSADSESVYSRRRERSRR